MTQGNGNGKGWLSWATASAPLPGQSESGDLAVVKPFSGGVLVAAVDGLGHGAEAAMVSRDILSVLEAHAGESVLALLRRCHEHSVRGRGAVMSLASFNTADSTMTWAGVGNVEGILVRADSGPGAPVERLFLQAGGIGFQFPRVTATVMPVDAGDTLIFSTDGVDPSFALRLPQGLEAKALADLILTRYQKYTDDALVLAAMVKGGRS